MIILLTDGQRTTGPDPIEIAKLAADRGVRVYTVGFGTTSGEIIGFEGWSFRVRLDEETLKTVATDDARRVLLRRHRRRPEEGLPDAQFQAEPGEEGNRDHRAASPASPRCSRCSRGCCRCSGSTGSSRCCASCRIAALAACVLVAVAPGARAQDIEPRVYSNAPVGVNFLDRRATRYTRGGLAFDPRTQITNPKLTTSSAVLAYARVLDLWGMSGKFDAIVPYTWLSGTARLPRRAGRARRRRLHAIPRSGCRSTSTARPRCRCRSSRHYQQDLIVGASLQVSVPVGQYDETRLVNLGTNRWSFKPELGVSKALGPWTLEGTACGDDLHGQQRLLQRQHALAGADLFGAGARDLQLRLRRLGLAGRHLLHRRAHDAERRAAATTCRRTGASAARSRCRSTRTTRSSSTPAAACRRAPATTSTCSAWPGSTAGAAVYDAGLPGGLMSAYQARATQHRRHQGPDRLPGDGRVRRQPRPHQCAGRAYARLRLAAADGGGQRDRDPALPGKREHGGQPVGVERRRFAAALCLPYRACRNHAPAPRMVREDGRGVPRAVVGAEGPPAGYRRGQGQARAAARAGPDGRGVHVPPVLSAARCAAGLAGPFGDECPAA